MAEQMSVSREIAAPADALWALVSDVTRMGEWSPETESVTWLGGATEVEVGARFRGTNRIGNKRWKTLATVIDADPGARFSFAVTAGPLKVAEWTYVFEPTASGCRVTESWLEQRPGFFKPIARLITGVEDRGPHNRAGMEQTLERLAAAAESPASPR